jgi:hypothetical protein
MEDSIELIAHRLSRGAGLGRMDAHVLQQWLLRFSKSSKFSRTLRQATSEVVDRLTNSFLPCWTAYRDLMVDRFVALDKCPGVLPIRVGQTWRRLATEANLLAAGIKAMELYGIHQLCAAGLEAGIKGGIQLCHQRAVEAAQR